MKTFKATAKKLDKGMQVEVSAAGFKMIFDEPEAMGGTNQGMNPMSGALGVMGACQTIVAFMFAKQHGIELEDFYVDIEGDMDMNHLMGKTVGRTGFQEVRYQMHFKSDADEEKLEEFADFIEKTCPVSDTFNQGTKMVLKGIVKE